MKIAVKLTKKQLDEKVETILKMKELAKRLNEDIKTLQALIEAQFELPAHEKETLIGYEYTVEKIPTNHACLFYFRKERLRL